MGEPLPPTEPTDTPSTPTAQPATPPKSKPKPKRTVTATPATAIKAKKEAERLLHQATPEGFAEEILRHKLYPKQRDALAALKYPGSKVILRTGNEVGKTRIVIASAVLWHLIAFPKGLVRSTAGAWRQVIGQLIPALKGHSHRFPHLQFNQCSITDQPGVQRYQGFSTRGQGPAQGDHGSLEEPLLNIIDEAGAVQDDIFMAMEERCNPQRLLITGSPLDPIGMFHTNCTRLASHYKQFRIAQHEVPHISQADILRTIRKFDPNALEGTDESKPLAPADWERIRTRCENPVVLSRVFADFGEMVVGGVCSLRELEGCWENAPEWSGEERHCFVDFAAGGAENVVAPRVGNKVWIEKAWREPNTMAAVGEMVRLFTKLQREHGFQAHEIEGDNDGLGKVMIDALHENGWPISRFHGNAAPSDEGYDNAISEVWVEGTKLIRRAVIIVPQDEELKSQLITRKSTMHASGKTEIESKKDMLRRGLPSPDRADAVLGAIRPPPRVIARSLLAPVVAPWVEALDMGLRDDDSAYQPGYNAGG